MAERARVVPPPSRRLRLLGLFVAAGAASWLLLGLRPGELVPAGNGASILGRFFHGALAPALDYEAASVPEGTPPFLRKVAAAARSTVLFAAGGMSLALVLGIVLGFLGSRVWWPRDVATGRAARRWIVFHTAVRIAIASMRSVHELLWALLFLAALGLNSFAAVLAIAIPYGGTLAKVFSEMLDEAPRDSARSLRAIGAPPLQVFLFGLVPRALPDAFTYAFYRFECAVRSSAVLGFFGYPTFGYYIRLSVENVHYREVWTYLYALFALVLALELWSGRLRRKVVMR